MPVPTPSAAEPDAAPAATVALVGELIALVRGLRELGAAVPPVHGRRLDLPAAAALGTLHDSGPMRLSTLAERLGLDLSTVSRQVPTLEQAGWLVRQPDPGDRRAQLLRLTADGVAALEARRRDHARVLTAALPGWSEDELSGLVATLSRLNRDLRAARPLAPAVHPASPPACASSAQPAPVHQEAS